MSLNNDDTFYKVTNKDIYEKLIRIEAKLEETSNNSGRAKLIATTALTLSLLVMGALISVAFGIIGN
jgi:hypothetical protein